MPRTIFATITDFNSLRQDADQAGEGNLMLGQFVAGHPFADGIFWTVVTSGATDGGSISGAQIDTLSASNVNGQTIQASDQGQATSPTISSPPTTSSSTSTAITTVTKHLTAPSPIQGIPWWQIGVAAAIGVVGIGMYMKKRDRRGY